MDFACRDDVVFHDDFLSIFPDYWASVPVNYEYIAVGMIPRHFNVSEKTVYGEQFPCQSRPIAAFTYFLGSIKHTHDSMCRCPLNDFCRTPQHMQRHTGTPSFLPPTNTLQTCVVAPCKMSCGQCHSITWHISPKPSMPWARMQFHSQPEYAFAVAPDKMPWETHAYIVTSRQAERDGLTADTMIAHSRRQSLPPA